LEVHTKNKKIIGNFPRKIISNVYRTLFNDIISQKKVYMDKSANHDDFNDIDLFEFVMKLDNSFDRQLFLRYIATKKYYGQGKLQKKLIIADMKFVFVLTLIHLCSTSNAS
jgi:NifB/MoaA-like Fe-S oxidoreductase